MTTEDSIMCVGWVDLSVDRGGGWCVNVDGWNLFLKLNKMYNVETFIMMQVFKIFDIWIITR